MFQLPEDIASRRALLDTLLSKAPVGLAFVDREFRYVWVNDALLDIDTARGTPTIGRTVAEKVPALWSALAPLYRRALAGESLVNQEVSGPISDDSPEIRHWLVSYYPVRQEQEVIGVGVIVHDISERTATEHALAVRNDLYAMLSRTNRAVSQCRSADELFAELCTIAVTIGRFRYAWIGVPENGRIRAVAGAGDHGGYMDALEISLDEHDPRGQGPTGRAARTGEFVVVNDFMASPMTSPWHARARAVGFAASAAFPLKERGVVVAVMTMYAATPHFFTDELVATLGEITPSVSFALDAFVQERERARREQQALQSYKMEALGRLAGGVAHDFNNLLTIINGYSDLLLEGASVDHPDKSALEEIRRAGEHASVLTRQLLTFSRQQAVETRDVALNDVVQETSSMLARLLGKRVELHTTMGDDLGTVKADVGQLSQVLINLAVNARDAMPNGGSLWISTDLVQLPDLSLHDLEMAAPGSYSRLTVRDSGTGIDSATKARIFEPFFTTKALGKGTGLGLSTVHGIVTQLEGYITLTSEVGVGTSFHVYLPATLSDAVTTPA
jgi:PAS domain S-box-containing protein